MDTTWLDDVRWDAEGLVPVIVQDAQSRDILMMAWADRAALLRTLETGLAHYWSRSRKTMWQKGEQSGHVQQVKTLRLDCDGDAIVLEVEQTGGIACHTGHASCFYRRLTEQNWQEDSPVLKNPAEMYPAKK